MDNSYHSKLFLSYESHQKPSMSTAQFSQQQPTQSASSSVLLGGNLNRREAPSRLLIGGPSGQTVHVKKINRYLHQRDNIRKNNNKGFMDRRKNGASNNAYM